MYFRSIRSAWIAAECTWIRCSAVESRYVTGFRRPSRSKVARYHIFSGLRAKVEIFNFCAQTGKFVEPGSVYAQSPSDSDGVLSFLSRAADPGAFCRKKPPIFIPKSACTAVRVQLLLGPCHAWTGYPKSQNSGHRSRALDSELARANAMGAVPIAFSARSSLSSTLERAHWPSAILPAARCWRLARRARWLAGRARASSQSQIYARCMHDLI